MPITQQILGRRLREAREANGMTQKEVAMHLGLSRPTIAQMESAYRAVSSLELDRLAQLYGRDFGSFLADEFEPQDALSALFRAQPDLVRQEEVAEALRQSLRLGRELFDLEGILGIPARSMTVAGYSRPLPATRWEAVEQGEWTAGAERRRLGLGSTAIENLAEVLEGQGVRTVWVVLPEDVSGLTLREPRLGGLVMVNSRHHWLRRRFSYAHEYAHVLLDQDHSGTISRSARQDDLREVRANAFAANFLMPGEGIRQFLAGLGKGRPSRVRTELFDGEEAFPVEGRAGPGTQDLQLWDVVLLAHHFGVSRLAAIYRLRSLRLVTEAELEALRQSDDSGKGRQIARMLNLQEVDHGAVRNEFRHRFLGLALEAYRREEITHGKLVELAGMVDMSRDGVIRLLEETGLTEDGVDVLLPA